VGPFAIPILYGHDFARSATVLTILLPGTIAFMAFKVLHMDIAGRGWPWVSIPIVVPSMLANAAAGALVVPRYGAEGAAAITSISYIVATALYVVIYAKLCRRSLVSVIAYRRSDFITLFERLRILRRP
jgi:O-antigen/teichoic acid export membrane protein